MRTCVLRASLSLISFHSTKHLVRACILRHTLFHDRSAWCEWGIRRIENRKNKCSILEKLVLWHIHLVVTMSWHITFFASWLMIYLLCIRLMSSVIQPPQHHIKHKLCNDSINMFVPPTVCNSDNCVIWVSIMHAARTSQSIHAVFKIERENVKMTWEKCVHWLSQVNMPFIFIWMDSYYNFLHDKCLLQNVSASQVCVWCVQWDDHIEWKI